MKIDKNQWWAEIAQGNPNALAQLCEKAFSCPLGIVASRKLHYESFKKFLIKLGTILFFLFPFGYIIAGMAYEELFPNDSINLKGQFFGAYLMFSLWCFFCERRLSRLKNDISWGVIGRCENVLNRYAECVPTLLGRGAFSAIPQEIIDELLQSAKHTVNKINESCDSKESIELHSQLKKLIDLLVILKILPDEETQRTMDGDPFAFGGMSEEEWHSRLCKRVYRNLFNEPEKVVNRH